MADSANSNMKKVGLECGGKSAFVLTKNYRDLDYAAEILARNIFYNQGQICSAPSRLIVHDSIKDEFLELLIDASRRYIPADPFDIKTSVGSLVDKAQYERVQSFIIEAEGNQYHVHTIGETEGVNEKGFFINPRIIDGVGQDDRLAQEEIFGPVLVVLTYQQISEAVAIANNSRYGLAASIWSDDLSEALTVSKQLDAGIVHVNSYGEDDNNIPFGGFKESGIGKDKSLHAFDEYSEMKSTIISYKRR